jgi:hypothetical protein
MKAFIAVATMRGLLADRDPSIAAISSPGTSLLWHLRTLNVSDLRGLDDLIEIVDLT